MALPPYSLNQSHQQKHESFIAINYVRCPLKHLPHKALIPLGSLSSIAREAVQHRPLSQQPPPSSGENKSTASTRGAGVGWTINAAPGAWRAHLLHQLGVALVQIHFTPLRGRAPLHVLHLHRALDGRLPASIIDRRVPLAFPSVSRSKSSTALATRFNRAMGVDPKTTKPRLMAQRGAVRMVLTRDI